MTMIAATCDNLLVRAGSWPRQALLVLAGSVLLWISAKVQVPFWPVPMTLQTLAVLGLAAALGRRLGVAAVVLYLMEGALGLPVFAGTPEKGIGLAYMAGPTGGYLAGFVLAAFIVGTLAERGLTKRLALPRTTWSSNSMPSSLPAEISSLVMSTSWELGAGSPEGWLWTTMIDGAFACTAGRNTSDARITELLTLPT